MTGGAATKALPPPRSRPPSETKGRGGEGGGRGREGGGGGRGGRGGGGGGGGGGRGGREGARGRYERQVQQENEKRMAHHNALVQIYTPKPIRPFFYTDERIRYSLVATHQLNSEKGTRHTAFHPSHISFASLSRPFLSLNESGPLDLGGKEALCSTLYCIINLSDTLGICNFCLKSHHKNENENENEDPSTLPFSPSPSSFSPAPLLRKQKEGPGEGESKEKERQEKGRKKEIGQVLETCNAKSFLSQQVFRFLPTWHDIDTEFESGLLSSSYSKSSSPSPDPPSSLHLPPHSPPSSSRPPPSASIILSSFHSLDGPEEKRGETKKEKGTGEGEQGKEKEKENDKVEEDIDKEKEKGDDEEEVGVYCQHPYPPQFQLLVSFPHGDVIRYDLVSRQLTARFNKSGALHSAEATDVRWVPGTKCTQFVVCFNDGVLLHYDLISKIQPEKKEEGFSRRGRRGVGEKKRGGEGSWSSSLSTLWNSVSLTEEKKAEETPATRAQNHVASDPTDIFVSKEKMRDIEGNADVICWKVSNKPISRASFSPPSSSSPLRFALVDREGYVKIFDWESSSLLFCLKSHFGCFLALEWSPCTRLLALGGEDDAVSVLDINRRKIVCRGEGHRSWVSFLSFLNEKEEKKEQQQEKRGRKRGGGGGSLSFSLASVGQDGYMCLWKGSLDDAGRPRSRTVSGLVKWERGNSTKSIQPDSNVASQLVTYPKSVPEIKPVAMHRSHNNPLSSVVYLPEGIVTACTSGILKLWKRDDPPQ